MLQIKDLSISFLTDQKPVKVIHHIDFELEKNQILGIVGESGSGKSVSSLAILGLLPKNKSIIEGQVLFNDNKNLYWIFLKNSFRE